ncbi:MAG: hypothetical protein WCI72_04210 [archaeon]
MVTSKDITPEYMQSRYQSDSLGNLEIVIPEVRGFVGEKFTIDTDLTTLWRYVANLHTFPTEIPNVDKRKVTPENISAVCIFGSTLYLNFPTQFARTRKDWFGFGKSVVETVRTKRKKPDDLDLMVITKEEVGEELFFPGKENIVQTSGEQPGEYGNYKVEGNLNLHFTYRSEKQFIETYMMGDKLSDAVMTYGLPIVGETNFNRIISAAPSSPRNVLHELVWGDNGRLNGIIAEAARKVCSQPAQSKVSKPGKSAISEPDPVFINPWDIQIPRLGETD